MILIGDFNGDIGNSLGENGEKEPNQRGLKLAMNLDWSKLRGDITLAGNYISHALICEFIVFLGPVYLC